MTNNKCVQGSVCTVCVCVYRVSVLCVCQLLVTCLITLGIGHVPQLVERCCNALLVVKAKSRNRKSQKNIYIYK